jgi:hypothetical protein
MKSALPSYFAVNVTHCPEFNGFREEAKAVQRSSQRQFRSRP